MRNKKWYVITVECVKYQTGCSMLVGEVIDIAKVQSKGTAYVCANALAELYTPEYFKISIK